MSPSATWGLLRTVIVQVGVLFCSRCWGAPLLAAPPAHRAPGCSEGAESPQGSGQRHFSQDWRPWEGQQADPTLAGAEAPTEVPQRCFWRWAPRRTAAGGPRTGFALSALGLPGPPALCLWPETEGHPRGHCPHPEGTPEGTGRPGVWGLSRGRRAAGRPPPRLEGRAPGAAVLRSRGQGGVPQRLGAGGRPHRPASSFCGRRRGGRWGEPPVPPALTSPAPPRGSPSAPDIQRSPAARLPHWPHPAWGQSSRAAGTGSLVPACSGRAWNPEAPPADRRAEARPRQERARASLSLQRLRSWNLHPLGFAIFTHPEPSGLHGDASKQQIPGSDDVTSPFPAAQAWRHRPTAAAAPGSRSRPPPPPPALPSGAGAPAPRRAESGCAAAPPPPPHCRAAAGRQLRGPRQWETSRRRRASARAAGRWPAGLGRPWAAVPGHRPRLACAQGGCERGPTRNRTFTYNLVFAHQCSLVFVY